MQELAYRSLMIDHARALGDDPLQIHPSPAHHPICRTIRTGLDASRQVGQLLRGEARWVALGPVVLQPVGTELVEAVDPVPHRLAVHAADACRVRPVHPVEHRRERHQTSAPISVSGRRGQAAKLTGGEVGSQANRSGHGAGPPRARESPQPPQGNPS